MQIEMYNLNSNKYICYLNREQYPNFLSFILLRFHFVCFLIVDLPLASIHKNFSWIFPNIQFFLFLEIGNNFIYFIHQLLVRISALVMAI
jgi:hypothetical protein